MTTTSRSASSPTPAMLIFKQTPNGRHRAAWFSGDEAAAAGKAAKSMGFRIKHLANEGDQKEVISHLPHGSLSNGGLTVPFVQRECLKQVLTVIAHKRTKVTGVRPNPPTNKKPTRGHSKAGQPVLVDVSPNSAPTIPHSWEEIEPGSEVLARDQHDETWYEAVVVSVVGDVCQLKWRDYPEQPVLTRQRHQLGLMYPK